MVGVGRHHLDDVAELVLRPRVGLVDLLGPAPLVVGEEDEYLAGGRMRLHVLGPIHARRLEEIGGEPRVDHHVGLRLETVGRREGPSPNTSGSHLTLPSSSKRATDSVPSESRRMLFARSPST